MIHSFSAYQLLRLLSGTDETIGRGRAFELAYSTQEEYLSTVMLDGTGLHWASEYLLELVSTWTQIPNPYPRTLPHGTPEWLALTPSFLRAMYIHVDACAYQLQ